MAWPGERSGPARRKVHSMATTVAAERSDPVEALSGAYIDLYPLEAADVLAKRSLSEIIAWLKRQPPRRAAVALERLSDEQASQCLAALSTQELRRIVTPLDPSRAAVLFSRLDPATRADRLQKLDTKIAQELQETMAYPVDSAGALMDTRISTFRPRELVKDVLAKLGRLRREDISEVLVIDDDGKLLALLPLARVAFAAPRQRLQHLIKEPAPRVHAISPREEVATVLSGTGLMALPVVDGQERLLGLLHHDAIVQAVKEQATGDIAALVGAGREELALSPSLYAVRKRLPWLNINLLTAFLAAAVVGLFESTIAQFTALAVLLPVVAGQSGNTGAQALAVVIRGLALREIRARDWAQVVVKEALVGTMNGVAIAIVTAVGVYVWSQSIGLCLVIFLAMILSMVIAGVSGATIPLVLSALRQDPAQSGSIILTTVTDVMGFFSFLGLATVFSTML